MSVQLVNDLVCAGRITAADGAALLELRRQVAFARWRKRHPVLFVLRAFALVLFGCTATVHGPVPVTLSAPMTVNATIAPRSE